MGDSDSRSGPDSATQRRQALGAMSNQRGYDFEGRISELYRLLQYQVEHGRLFGGRQVDLFLVGQFGDLTVHRAIECKAGPVTTEHIDVFIAKLRLVRREYPAAQGTIVSGASFTDAVTTHAAAEGIQLTLDRELASTLFDGRPYVQGLVRECESSSMYPLQQYIEPAISFDTSGKSGDGYATIEDWLSDPGWNQFTVLGDVGTGKTFLTRMLAYNLGLKFLESPARAPMPLRIDLRNVDRELSLEGLIATSATRAGIPRLTFDVFQYALAEGTIILILDGFDEMAASTTPQITTRNFHELAKCVRGRAKVLLTCRTHYFRSRTEEQDVILGKRREYDSEVASELYWDLIARKGFQIGYLAPFSLPQIEEYVQRARPDFAKEALHRIRTIYNLMELSQRPMLLDMIVKSIDRLHGESINPATLYTIFTDTWVFRDRWRDVLSPELKLEFLTALARTLWDDDRRTLHHTALASRVRHDLQVHVEDPQRLVELDGEIRTASFLVRDAAGHYGFAHKSHLEFFVARHLAAQLAGGTYSCLDGRRISPEIAGFLKYMLKLESIEPSLERILLAQYSPRVSENALVCLYIFRRDRVDDEIVDHVGAVALPDRMQLDGAQLEKINLEGACMRFANFAGARLTDAVLTLCNLDGVLLRDAGMRAADLRAAVLTHADLTRADLTTAVLENAILDQADLTDADFTRASLLKVSASDAKMTGVRLQGVAADHDGPFSVALAFQSSTAETSPLPSPTEERNALLTRAYPMLASPSRMMALRFGLSEDDVRNEAAIQLASRLGQFVEGEEEDSARLERYVQTTVINAAYGLLRKQNRHDRLSGDGSVSSRLDGRRPTREILMSEPFEALDPSADPESQALVSEIIEKVHTLLSDDAARVLIAYLTGLSLAEIADIEGLSKSRVSRVLNRAMTLLRRHFENDAALEPSSVAN